MARARAYYAWRFMDASTILHLVFAFGIVFVAGMIKGAIAFGFPLFATPLLAALFGAKTAVLLLTPAALVLNLVALVARRAGWDVLKRMAPTLVCMAPATLVGTLLLAAVDAHVLSLIVGAFAFGFAALSLTKLRLRVSPRVERPLSPIMGVVSGLLQGATGISGPVVTLYVDALHFTPRGFAFGATLLYALGGTIQAASYAHLGLYTPQLLLGAGALIPIGLVGQQVGFVIQDALHPHRFRQAVIGFVALSSVNLVLRGLGAL